MNAFTALVSSRGGMWGRAIEAQKSFWVLADQAVVSAGSFLTSIVLARQLAPHDYGIYALLIGLLLAANTVQGAVISYPLMVRGAIVDETAFRRMAVTALALGAALALAFSLVVGGGIERFEASVDLAAGTAFALFAWQLQQGTRSALLARQRYGAACPGDMLSYCGQAVIVWILLRVADPALPVVFVVVGLTSLLSTGLQFGQLQLFKTQLRFDRSFPRDAWSLGRWMFLTSVVSTALLQIFIWGLTIGKGSAELAKYQSLINILGLTHPLLLSLGNFILPAVALVNARTGVKNALRVAFVRATPAAILMIPVLLALLLFGQRVLTLVYGAHSPYRSLMAPLRWFVAAYAFQLVGGILGSFLNGVEQPRATFAANLVGAATAGLLGLPLVIQFGVVGAASGLCLACAARALATAVLAYRITCQRGAYGRWSIG